MEAVTALAGGRVVVTYLRRATRVLEAATGEEVRYLHGVSRMVALTQDLLLVVGGGWCRLLDRSLDPLGPRITTGLGPVWHAPSDGERWAITDNGFLCILDPDGNERARVTDHFRHLVHDPASDTWVGIQQHGPASLIRLNHDAEVLEKRPCAPARDVTTTRAGRGTDLAHVSRRTDPGLLRLEHPAA